MAEDPLDRSIDDIGLSAGTTTSLKRAQIVVVRDLLRRTDAEILKTKGISRARWMEIKHAVEKLGLALGMPPTSSPPLPVPPSDPVALRFLEGDPAVIDALAHGDPPTWKAWLEHLLRRKPVAAVELIERMLDREASPARWIETASQALDRIDSEVFFIARSAMKPFQAWLGDGIIAARGPIAPASLEVRLERELDEANGSETARALVGDLVAVGAASSVLGDALLLLSRRLAEEREHPAAIESLLQAEAILDAPARAFARRCRAANLLSLRRFDDAFAILDGEMTVRVKTGHRGAMRTQTPEDKWDAAIAEAAQVAVWATATTPEWVRALGGIAQRADAATKRDLWQRFERALVAMVDTSENPGSDLEVVIRQAKQRRLQRTASAAEMLAVERGIALEANFYVG